MSLKDAIREAAGERDKQNTPQIDTAQENTAVVENPLPETAPVQRPAPPKAAPTASLKAVNTASHKAVKQADIGKHETAAMTVRVSKRHRLHWLIAAKREGTSLTAAITEALNARFGEPDD